MLDKLHKAIVEELWHKAGTWGDMNARDWEQEDTNAVIAMIEKDEIECPCCGEWEPVCSEPNHHSNNMCAFCTLGQHNLEAPCRPV